MSTASSYTHAAGGPLRRRRAFILVLAALLAAALAAVLIARSASQAVAAVNVSCGQVLTASTVLANDLQCGNGGDGLIAGKAGITINLNGHRISGSAGDVGINTNGWNKVVVTNGEIKNFGTGVRVPGGASVQVKSMRISGASGQGVDVREGASNAVVSQNNVFSVGSVGIRLVEAVGAKITNNTVSNAQQSGIQLINDSNGAVLQGNKALNNRTYGIESLSFDTQFTANVANGNGFGGILNSFDQFAKLTNNTANYNDGLGIDTVPGVIDGGKNKATGNSNPRVCKHIVCSPSKGI